MKKIFATLFIFFLLACCAFAQVESIKNLKEKISTAADKAVSTEENIVNKIDYGIKSLLSNTVAYITNIAKEEKGKEPPRLDLKEYAILTVGNLLLSLFCLIFAISLVTKASLPKRYLWFLFAFNITWLIVTMIAKGVWGTLDYLIIKLQPDLAPRFYDNFFIVFVIFTILIYIWLLARTFGLNFFGALGSFAVAHAAYIFVVIFFFAVYNPPIQNKLYLAAKDSIGIRGVVSSYVVDMNNITTNTSLPSFIKLKYFHI